MNEEQTMQTERKYELLKDLVHDQYFEIKELKQKINKYQDIINKIEYYIESVNYTTEWEKIFINDMLNKIQKLKGK